MRNPAQISREMTINLSENGVSSGIFIDLFYQSMENVISPLLNWDGQDAMAKLWVAVAKEGSVMAARITRESPWAARVHGLQLYDQDNSTEDDDSLSHSIAWWGDEISGCPSSLEETIMSFLDTGFHPAFNSALAEKLQIVAKKAVKSCISKSRVTIPMSCSALIVPGMLFYVLLLYFIN
jgi:RNA-dependent RNA polymerase